MQRIKNYGSFLQAYALKKIIESQGHKVEFVDYKVEDCLNTKKDVTENKSCFFKRILNLIKLCFSKKRRKARKMYKESEKFFNSFENEFWKIIGLSKENNYRAKVDTLVIGSDEVFNCTQNNKNVGYSKELFGYNNNAKKVISYAASFGSTTIEKIEEYHIKKELSNMLSKFKAISVRDKNSGNIIKELTGIEPYYNLDPVLIYDFENEITKETVKIKDYIIVYAYSERIQEKEQIEIKKFAKKYNKKLITIGTIQPFCDIYIPDVSPFVLLEYIKKADYIITDTFHGTIYSIKYNKQFATIIRNSNRQKLTDLLERCYKEDRMIEDIKDMEGILTKKIDYKKTNKFIQEEKGKTINYLIENL